MLCVLFEFTLGVANLTRPQSSLENSTRQHGKSILYARVVLMLGSMGKVDAACTQFAANGSSSAYYNFHRFYDFRNLTSTADVPSLPATFDDGVKHLSKVSWSEDWKAVSWFRPSSKPENSDMQYIASDVSISTYLTIGHSLSSHFAHSAQEDDSATNQDSPAYLSLRARKLRNGTQLATELDYTENNVLFASIRVMARVRGASGAVAGIFTYFNDTTESDIEIRTRDPSTEVHLSNQPTTDLTTTDAIPGATFNKPITDYREWNVYRLDWVRGRSAWYMNGMESARTEVNVPETSSTVILDMWSNGGDFSGKMQPGDEASFEIQWIELVYNTTSVTEEGDEGEVCSIEFSPGSPVPLASVNVQWSTRNTASDKNLSRSIAAVACIALSLCF